MDVNFKKLQTNFWSVMKYFKFDPNQGYKCVVYPYRPVYTGDFCGDFKRDFAAGDVNY